MTAWLTGLLGGHSCPGSLRKKVLAAAGWDGAHLRLKASGCCRASFPFSVLWGRGQTEMSHQQSPHCLPLCCTHGSPVSRLGSSSTLGEAGTEMTGGDHYLAFSSGSQMLGSELSVHAHLVCLDSVSWAVRLCLPSTQHQRMLCANTPDVFKLILPLVYVCASMCG